MATLELYLIRHGVAAERGEEYPGRLEAAADERGHRAAAQGSAGARRARRRRSIRFCPSPLVRTRQTADVFAEVLKSKPPIATIGRADAGRVRPAAVIQELGKHMRKARVALVGHEPNMGELAAHLIGAKVPLPFKKGAICRIDFSVFPPKGKGELCWFVTPKHAAQARRRGQSPNLSTHSRWCDASGGTAAR